MGQSLVRNYIHIVFSTKHRRPLINAANEKSLYAYIASICSSFGSHPVIVGGHIDHVHLLIRHSKNISLVELLKKVKAQSSKWMKTQGADLKDFYWQDGYGAFSVSPGSVKDCETYIRNQHAHHYGQDFKTEFIRILKQYRVEYDERFVWD